MVVVGRHRCGECGVKGTNALYNLVDVNLSTK